MRKIPLRDRAGNIVAYTLVDNTDYDRLNRWKWCLQAGDRGYAGRREGKRIVLMHRVLLGLEPGDGRQTDHRNRNPLDNQRSNLRIATDGENKQNLGIRPDNMSGYRGVSFTRKTGRWRAKAQLDGRQVHLGYFATPEEAAAVVEEWRRAHMPFAMN